MKSSLLTLAFAYSSLVSAQTTQWDDYTVTLTPSSMYKQGSSTSASSPPPTDSSSSYGSSSSSAPSSTASSYDPSSLSSSSSSPDESSSQWNTAWNSGFSTAFTSSTSITPSYSSSEPSSTSVSPSSTSFSPSPSGSSYQSSLSTQPSLLSVPSSSSSPTFTSSGDDTPSPSSAQPGSTSFFPVTSIVTYQPSTPTEPSSPPSPSSSSTPTSGDAGGSQTMDADTASTLLELHNEKRAKHQDTAPLTWSDSLSAWSYGYANSLKGTEYDPCSGILKHSSDRNNQGENIAYATNADWTFMIDMWYNEIQYYDYNDITGIYHDGMEVGHFTQLVWAASQQVGCASVQCPNDGTYLLCEYSPEGNVYDGNVGEDEFSLFRENVKPLI
ncbi:hypothetical protein ZYGM_002977 [Zygosaccharomyces mellis]|uniref:SCP domain-containing protein n=1 Tax=Zygosaccharomyces mellis TaxID=42258 RepID=A0A4C2EB94_9SACH|nr:hypothetical protein ZYGM_002977 [Zygosaccharomyces mellis]